MNAEIKKRKALLTLSREARQSLLVRDRALDRENKKQAKMLSFAHTNWKRRQESDREKMLRTLRGRKLKTIEVLEKEMYDKARRSAKRVRLSEMEGKEKKRLVEDENERKLIPTPLTQTGRVAETVLNALPDIKEDTLEIRRHSLLPPIGEKENKISPVSPNNSLHFQKNDKPFVVRPLSQNQSRNFSCNGGEDKVEDEALGDIYSGLSPAAKLLLERRRTSEPIGPPYLSTKGNKRTSLRLSSLGNIPESTGGQAGKNEEDSSSVHPCPSVEGLPYSRAPHQQLLANKTLNKAAPPGYKPPYEDRLEMKTGSRRNSDNFSGSLLQPCEPPSWLQLIQRRKSYTKNRKQYEDFEALLQGCPTFFSPRGATSTGNGSLNGVKPPGYFKNSVASSLRS